MSANQDVVIVAAKRTAIGTFSGAFATTPAQQLGEAVMRDLLQCSNLSGDTISEVILGQVLTAGSGQNPARQSAVNAGVSIHTPAMTINQVCGSGLRAACLGAAAIVAGDSQIVIAGGQENMSMSAHAAYIRAGVKMGNASLVDTMITDGLMDAFNNIHMGITAENIAKEFDISRAEQDEFAFNSQSKADAAIKAGKFKDEITPVIVKNRKGDITVDTDEHPRLSDLDSLAKLRPAFDKEGTVTAGNASGLNDGAAAVVLMSRAEAEKRGLTPLATIKSYAHAGVEPKIMGTGPIPASKKALEKAGWGVGDLELIEANEAFAAQAISVNKAMGWNTDLVNVNGGAIALGHPIGASGTRVLVTLLYEMQKRDAKKALATLCIGGGMGVAMCLQR